MKLSENEWMDVALKILGAIGILYILRKVSSIYKGKDGLFDQTEFGRFVGFWFFLGAATWILYKEGTRPVNTQHIFSEIWLALVFTALLTVLHMERVMDKFVALVEAFVKLRMKAGTTLKSTETVVHTEEVKKEEQP